MLDYIRKVEREDRKLIFIFDNYKVILESNLDDVWEVNKFLLKQLEMYPIIKFRVVFNEILTTTTKNGIFREYKSETLDTLMDIELIFKGVKKKIFEDVRYLSIYWKNSSFDPSYQEQNFEIAIRGEENKLDITFLVEKINTEGQP